MSIGPFESHIASLPYLPAGLTSAELILATTNPAQVDDLQEKSALYTRDLLAARHRVVMEANAIDETYFGRIDELDDVAASAVNDRLRVTVKSGEAPDPSDLNALFGYDPTIATERYLDNGSDDLDYMDKVDDADARIADIDNAIISERVIHALVAATDKTAGKVRIASGSLGATSMLLVIGGSATLPHAIGQETDQAVDIAPREEAGFLQDVDTSILVGGIGIAGAALAVVIGMRARRFAHWRARRKVRSVGAADILKKN